MPDAAFEEFWTCVRKVYEKCQSVSGVTKAISRFAPFSGFSEFRCSLRNTHVAHRSSTILCSNSSSHARSRNQLNISNMPASRSPSPASRRRAAPAAKKSPARRSASPAPAPVVASPPKPAAVRSTRSSGPVPSAASTSMTLPSAQLHELLLVGAVASAIASAAHSQVSCAKRTKRKSKKSRCRVIVTANRPPPSAAAPPQGRR